MCSIPNKPSPYPSIAGIVKYKEAEDATQNQSHRTSESDDPEKQAAGKAEQDVGTMDLNHYRFVNQVWHYNSVDSGTKCKLLPGPVGYREDR